MPRPDAQPKPPDVPSIHEQLYACSWRDISFPVSSFKTSFSHDLAEHKYVGVDVADVEATGRNSMVIEAQIPLVNGIVPGKTERWTAGRLYPTTFVALRKAFADASTGVLVHPDIGLMSCKPRSFEYELDPHRRDGVLVTVSWIETLDERFDQTLSRPESPVQQLRQGALSLDASKSDIKKLAPDTPEFEEDLFTSVDKITGFLDRVSTTTTLVANKPKQLGAKLTQVQDSAARARTALTWPVTDAVDRMKSALHDIPNAITAGRRAVLRYTTPTRMALSSIAATLGAPVDDLINLNPSLLSNPEVGAGVVVRYFKS